MPSQPAVYISTHRPAVPPPPPLLVAGDGWGPGPPPGAPRHRAVLARCGSRVHYEGVAHPRKPHGRLQVQLRARREDRATQPLPRDVTGGNDACISGNLRSEVHTTLGSRWGRRAATLPHEAGVVCTVQPVGYSGHSVSRAYDGSRTPWESLDLPCGDGARVWQLEGPPGASGTATPWALPGAVCPGSGATVRVNGGGGSGAGGSTQLAPAMVWAAALPTVDHLALWVRSSCFGGVIGGNSVRRVSHSEGVRTTPHRVLGRASDALEEGEAPPPPLHGTQTRPGLSLTASAGFNGICNRQ